MTPAPVPRVSRACDWLAGPRSGIVTIAPVRWWLALSRDARTARFRRSRHGMPAARFCAPRR